MEKELSFEEQAALAALKDFQKKIKYAFKDEMLLLDVCLPEKERQREFGRLEELGDKFYRIAIGKYYYDLYPDWNGKKIANRLHKVETNKYLEKMAQMYGWEEYLALSDKPTRHLADRVEALVGAVFIDGGYEKAAEFVVYHFLPDRDRKY